VTLHTDPGKVRQILLNLAGNAVKFTERGSVVITARLEGDTVCFEVRDTGPGIDAQQLEHVFDAFWQGEHTLTRAHGGAGLGLSVVRKLCVLLGGDVAAASMPGRGSIFTARIPRDARSLGEQNGRAMGESGTS
jgi:signal transduction histidine kinase